MKFHPAVLMLLTWLSAVAIFLILPFRLEGRVMSLYGVLILAVFIGVFCLGALAATRPKPQRRRDPRVTVNFHRADQVLLGACALAVAVLAIDLALSGNILDLAAAYAQRSDRATALLRGAESDSTIFFQIGFLLYPAGNVLLVREIAFKPRPLPWRIALGMAPSVMASLAMGGRGVLLFVVIFAVYAYMLRKQMFPQARKMLRRPVAGQPAMAGPRGPMQRRKAKPFRFGPGFKVAMGVGFFFVMVYIIQVFIARADVAGGVEMAFGDIGQRWGVSFNGHFSNLYYGLLGVEGTYMVFVFAWYWIQGLIMSNEIFTSYDGPMLMGTYGVDLVSAAMRRINGEFVAEGFDRLLRMNVYGFLPSAFGSLYVDFKFFGLIPCAIWGYLTGVVYRKVKAGVDPRWLLWVPFVSTGIVLSLNNTPIGFSNGLMIHAWLLLTFLLTKAVRVDASPVTAPSPAPRPA